MTSLQDDDTTSARSTRWEVPALVLLIALGAVVRAHGFTTKDLWFDDAWAASSARTNLSQAVHMFLTAPGYGFFQREWIRLNPLSTWWAQIPAFIFGLAAIPATWWLLKWMKFASWIAIGGAMFMAVNPTLVLYSTRVKEYPFDLLLSLGLLALAELVRRTPEHPPWRRLALASVVALAFSASMIVVVGGVWLFVLAVTFRTTTGRRNFVLFGGAVTVFLGGLYVLFYRHVPSVLNFNWRRRGYLADYRTTHLFERTVRLIFGGFAHTGWAYPVPKNFYRTGHISQALSPVVAGVCIVGVLVAGPLWWAWRQRRMGRGVAASLTLGVAILLAFADQVPFGDGRTDEVLYPAVVLATAVVASTVVSWLRVRNVAPAARQSLLVVAATVVVVGAITVGVRNEAIYPTLDLRTLSATLDRANAVDRAPVVVDTFNSFGWCYYRLSPCDYVIGGDPVWPQGFRPQSMNRHVIISESYSGQYHDVIAELNGKTRLWYVGYTYGTFDALSPRLAHVPAMTNLLGSLYANGWKVVSGTGSRLTSTNVFAQLLERNGR